MPKPNDDLAAKIAALDQASAFMTNNMPSMWFSMFSRCTEEGFTPEQALYLVGQLIHGMAASPIIHTGGRDD